MGCKAIQKMQIPQELAQLVACAAISEPYRQIGVMHTGSFAHWLGRRGISLQWQTIHHLWSVGVLHPIAVLEPALSAAVQIEGRFIPVPIDGEVVTYVDLGMDVAPDTSLQPSWQVPSRLANCVLWHPFQLWQFARLAKALEVCIALDASLTELDSYCRLVRLSLSSVQSHIIEDAQTDRIHAFLRVLGLLLLAEPLVHVIIDSRVRLTHLDETIEDYVSWCERQNGTDMLQTIGSSLNEVEQWHRDIAVQAQLDDPVEVFRPLLRLANRDKRSRLSGAALRAHELYDSAEVLRRYCEQYHGQRFLEEDDVRHGPHGQVVKQGLYGSKRTTDFNRRIFRRIAREFGVDPQARTTWFVEGDTEEAFIQRMAQHFHVDLLTAGLDIENLNGIGGLKSDRLQGFLARLQREEVFAFVSVDRDDRREPLRWLRQYAARDLLPAGFRVWEPDFEGANFSLDELAQVASGVAVQASIPLSLRAEDIRREMDERKLPAGKAIERLWSAAHFPGGKGPMWGQALANWAVQQPSPPSIADGAGDRPVVALLLHFLRNQHSDYPATLEMFEVTSSGALVPRA